MDRKKRTQDKQTNIEKGCIEEDGYKCDGGCVIKGWGGHKGWDG